MKKLFIISLFLMVIYSCKTGNNDPFLAYEKAKDRKIEALGYDFEKDAYINRSLNTDPINIGYSYGWFVILYSDIIIEVYHKSAEKFKQKEEWDFYCTDANGKVIMIESPLGIPKHRVSNITIEKIKSICKQYEQRQPKQN